MAWFALLRKVFAGAPPSQIRQQVAAAAAPAAVDLHGGLAPESSAPASAAAAVGADRAPPGIDVERRFTVLLVGAARLRKAPAEPAELRALARMKDLAASGAADLVPRLPIVLPRLISAVRREAVSSSELAQRVALDPTLVAEVVRLANSPRYRTSRQVADLQEAILMLGQRGLMQIVIAAAMRPIFDPRRGRFSRLAGTRVWDLAQRCAQACAMLCPEPDARFDAYLAGIVSNIGMVPALQVLDDQYREQRAPDTEEFHAALGPAVAMLSGRIARQWDFDSRVCEAVERRTCAAAADEGDPLILALRAAERVSKLHLLSPGLGEAELSALGESERRCYRDLESTFGR